MSRSTRRRRQLRRARHDDRAPERLVLAAEGEPLRRWLGPVEFTHRGLGVLRIVPLGIIVEAATPEELDERIDEEIARRTTGQRAS